MNVKAPIAFHSNLITSIDIYYVCVLIMLLLLLLSVFAQKILCVPDIYRRKYNLLQNITQLGCTILIPLLNCACIVWLFDEFVVVFFTFLFLCEIPIFYRFWICYSFTMSVAHYQSHLWSTETRANSFVLFISGTVYWRIPSLPKFPLYKPANTK